MVPLSRNSVWQRLPRRRETGILPQHREARALSTVNTGSALFNYLREHSQETRAQLQCQLQRSPVCMVLPGRPALCDRGGWEARKKAGLRRNQLREKRDPRVHLPWKTGWWFLTSKSTSHPNSAHPLLGPDSTELGEETQTDPPPCSQQSSPAARGGTPTSITDAG